MPHPPRRLSLPAPVAGTLLAGALLAGCTLPAPSAVAPQTALPAAFSASGSAVLPARWWEHLGDAELAVLAEAALTGNPGLAQSWDRLRAARAALRVERSDELPSLDATAQRRNRFDQDRSLGDDYTLGATASYEVDLWGRVRAASVASTADLTAREADLDTAAITLSANVAEAWFALVEQRAIRDLRRAQIEINARVQELTEFRFAQGRAALADVLRQRQLVEQRRGEVEDNLAEIAVRENALATLMGRAPGLAEIPRRAAFRPLPPLPATGLPLALVERRPDVRAARHAVEAADARVAAAIAEQYPRLDLSASFTAAAARPGALFSDWLASLVAQIAAPVFDAGRRAGEVERRRALLSEALNAYEEAVLRALREVEDALARERHQRAKLASLRRQRQLSQEVVERLSERYTQGQEDFLDVLNALISEQDLARQVIVAERQLRGFRTDLARALAGGWQMVPPAPRRQEAAT